MGAIRSGKTVAACARVLLHCDLMPGSDYLVGRKRFTDLHGTTLKELFRLVAERNGGSYDKPGPYVTKWDGQFNNLYLRSGSVIRARHVDNVQNILGMELSGYMLDQAEEIDEEVFYHIDSRLSFWNAERRERFKALNGFYPKHFAGLVANPDPGWIKKLLIENPAKEWKVYETDIEHNRKHLGPDYIESLYRTHPKDWCDRFLKGSWDIRGGQVYKEFNADFHVIEPFPIPDHWPRFLSLDWGINEHHRCAVYWAAVDEAGTIYVYKELSVTGKLASEVAALIHEMSEGEIVPREGEDDGITVYMDPSTDRRNGVVDRTIMSEFAQHRVYGLKANNEVDAGINKVAERLHVDPITGRAGLYIFKGACPWLVRGLKLYMWQPPNMAGISTGKPVKKDDDECDSLRYLVMAILENTSSAGPRPKMQISDYDRMVLQQMLTQTGDAPGEEW